MAQNLMIDPTTRDYLIPNGSPVETDRIQEKAYMALKIPAGKYLYLGPNQGSLLWTFENSLRTSNLDQKINAAATDALTRQLVNTGDATQVLARNVGFSRTESDNEFDVEATQVQVSNQISFVSVG